MKGVRQYRRTAQGTRHDPDEICVRKVEVFCRTNTWNLCSGTCPFTSFFPLVRRDQKRHKRPFSARLEGRSGLHRIRK